MKKQLLILSALLMFSINSFAQIPTNGLIGYYPFTGNAYDASGNGNNGTVKGAVLTKDRFGNLDGAYSFDGVADTIKLNIQQNNVSSYSISGWFKTSVGGPIIAGRGLSNQTGLTLHIHNDKTGGVNAGKGLFVADGSLVSIGKITNNTYVDNQWHHIVGVFNGSAGSINASQFSIYIDNNLVAQTNTNTGSTTAPINNLTNVLIGAHQVWNSGGVFNGTLDDIGIWNRALTVQEISNLFNLNTCEKIVYTSVSDTLIINTKLSGISVPNNINMFKVYPNPTNDHIVIDNGNYLALNGYSIKITNNIGQEVFQSTINQQQFDINLSSWNRGIYFLHIIDSNSNILEIKKIVLK